MPNNKYRILSLDGGGVRGLLTVSILEKIHQIFPSFLDNVDLIAGTSSGGIIALGLAAGLTPSQLRDFYDKHAKNILDDSLWDNIRDFGTAIGAQYDNVNLKRAIEATLKKVQLHDGKLSDLEKKVLITTFDLNNEKDREVMLQHQPISPAYQLQSWKPKFFDNFTKKLANGMNNPDLEEKIVDVAMNTSAAPTFFPAYERFIDGGVVANNPSMCALAQALNRRAGSQEIGDIVLLSIGTGREPLFIQEEDIDWGWVQWMVEGGHRWLIEIMMDGSVGLADYQCHQILDNRYHRYNPILNRNIKLDDWRGMNSLEMIIEGKPELIRSLFGWIEVNWINE